MMMMMMMLTPILKKSGLDEASPSSYRPISSLSVISKTLERLVARQLVTYRYLDANCLLSSTQSGFRRGYSTETTIIRVLSDLLDAVDRNDTAMLVSPDLSVAFDTADHGILLERLRVTFGVDNSALAWFRSYLAGRRQHVSCGGKCSVSIDVTWGMCHRGRSSGRYSLFFTWPTWRRSSRSMVCHCTSTLMIVRYMAHVGLMPPLCSPLHCHSVLTASPAGCVLIASNSIPTRQR